MNPFERYQQQMVSTMTQREMLLKLFDEVLKQIEIARRSIAANQVAEMTKAIEKAERIVRFLRETLDFRFPVSNNLAKLYEFFNAQLVMANIKKDAAPLNDIEPLIRDLRDTFDECGKLARAGQPNQAVGDMV